MRTFQRVAVGALLGVALGLSGVPFLRAAEPDGRAAVAQTIRQLASCSAQLSQILPLQAALVEGTLVDWATVKREIETANSGMTFDVATKTITVAHK